MKEVTVVTAIDEMRIDHCVVHVVMGRKGTTEAIAQRDVEKARVMATLMASNYPEGHWDSNSYAFIMRGDELLPYHVLRFETWQVPDQEELSHSVVPPTRMAPILPIGKLRSRNTNLFREFLDDMNDDVYRPFPPRKKLRKPSRRQS